MRSVITPCPLEWNHMALIFRWLWVNYVVSRVQSWLWGAFPVTFDLPAQGSYSTSQSFSCHRFYCRVGCLCRSLNFCQSNPKEYNENYFHTCMWFFCCQIAQPPKNGEGKRNKLQEFAWKFLAEHLLKKSFKFCQSHIKGKATAK